MTLPIAVIGSQALYLFFVWMASAIISSYLSGRKGYGERVGLASGLIVPVISPIAWIFWPAKPGSDWKVVGPFGSTSKADKAAPMPDSGSTGPGPTTVTGG